MPVTQTTVETQPAFTAWRKRDRGRWQALGTFPTERLAWEALDLARQAAPPGDSASMILRAGEEP